MALDIRLAVPRGKAGLWGRVKEMMRHKCVVRACDSAYAVEQDVIYTKVYIDEHVYVKDIGCSNAGLWQ